jgi:CheY-like chemotaxis protein
MRTDLSQVITANHDASPQVLVVEDHQAIRETTTAILRAAGFVVMNVADGVEALDMLRHHDVDVLLLDLGLPRMNGPELLERLVDPPPVVVVSGFEHDDEADIRYRFQRCVVDCLHKPVSPARLVDATSGALRHAAG